MEQFIRSILQWSISIRTYTVSVYLMHHVSRMNCQFQKRKMWCRNAKKIISWLSEIDTRYMLMFHPKHNHHKNLNWLGPATLENQGTNMVDDVWPVFFLHRNSSALIKVSSSSLAGGRIMQTVQKNKPENRSSLWSRCKCC